MAQPKKKRKKENRVPTLNKGGGNVEAKLTAIQRELGPIGAQLIATVKLVADIEWRIAKLDATLEMLKGQTNGK